MSPISPSTRPDLVFTDMIMAGEIDGLALARRIRSDHPGLPVLLTTGYSQSAEALHDEFPILLRPYHLNELSRALVEVLGGSGPDGGSGTLVDLSAARRVRRA